MNLRNIDLNLLVVLDALIDERSVGRAGDRVGLSASATSHALNRLRKLLNDPLFIRTTAGMEPTPRALEIAESARRALQEIQRALTPPHFDPLTGEAEFTLAVETYETIVILPQLIKMLHLAPNVRVKVITGSIEEIIASIDQGRTDVAIGRFDNLPDRFMISRLLKDSYICAMRAENPAAQADLTRDAYFNANHLLISLSGASYDAVDDVLEKMGRQRRITLQVPHGLAAAIALSQTDLIATVTRGVAKIFSENSSVCLRELPFEVPEVEFRIAWHQRINQSPSHKWLRQKLAAIGVSIERSFKPQSSS